MAWPAVAALAATSALGGFLGSKAQEEANKVNRQNAKDQMSFQEKMSNTAHQREMQDLLTAGLNPLLAAGGSGASSPSGALTNVSAAPDPVGAALRDSVSGAKDAHVLMQDLKQKDAQRELTQASVYNADSQRHVNEQNSAKLAYENSRTHLSQRDRVEVDKLTNQALKDEAVTRSTEARLNRERATQDTKFLQFDSLNKRIHSGLGTLNSASDIIKPFSSNSSRQTTTERYNSQGEHTGTTVQRKK